MGHAMDGTGAPRGGKYFHPVSGKNGFYTLYHTSVAGRHAGHVAALLFAVEGDHARSDRSCHAGTSAASFEAVTTSDNHRQKQVLRLRGAATPRPSSST